MSIRNRRIGPAASFAARGEEIDVTVDVQAVVRRLLLFDTYILSTHRLLEIPRLVSAFGSSGLIDLLESGALKFTCEAVSVADTGRGFPGLGQKPLPPHSYRVDVVREADADDYIHNSLQIVHTIAGPAHKDAKRLKVAIVDHIERSPANAGLDAIAAVRGDVSNPRLVSHLYTRAVRLFGHADIDPADLTLTIRQIEPNAYHLESNLRSRGIDDAATNEVLRKTLLSIAHLAYCIEEMRNFSAVSGVLEDEALDLISRLSFLIPEREGEQPERTFTRVVEVADLPEVLPGDGRVLDAQQLLKIRDTTECRAFRDWLKGAGGLSDAEVRNLVRGFHARISSVFQSTSGKVLRFVAVSALGFKNSAAGVVVGAIDQFVLDRMLRESGPVAFLNRLYPSIFRATL